MTRHMSLRSPRGELFQKTCMSRPSVTTVNAKPDPLGLWSCDEQELGARRIEIQASTVEPTDGRRIRKGASKCTQTNMMRPKRMAAP
jgi:hypothetical protein